MTEQNIPATDRLVRPYQEERPWGNFRQFTRNASSTVKIITVNTNESLSLQSHASRSEFWHVVSGSGIVEIDGEKFAAKKGDEFEIAIGSKHRLSAGSEGLEILEIAQGEFDEADIVRYEDKYGRMTS